MSLSFQELKKRIAHREALAREGRAFAGDMLDALREKRLGPACLTSAEIESYVERRLPLRSRFSAWRHLRHCPVCQHDVAEFREVCSAVATFEKELAQESKATSSNVPDRPLSWADLVSAAFSVPRVRLAGVASLLALALIAGAMAFFGSSFGQDGSLDGSRGVAVAGFGRIAVTFLAVATLVGGAFILSCLWRRSNVTGAASAARVRKLRIVLAVIVLLSMVAASASILRLVSAPAPPRSESFYVPHVVNTQYVGVVVGITNWTADPRMRAKPLAGSVNDAELIAKLWRDVGYHVIELTQGGSVTNEPTLANITSNLMLVARSCKNLTNASVHLRVYWAGHGIGSGGIAYLIPSDGRSGNLEDTCITREDIISAFAGEGVALASFAIMTDACWLGADNLSREFVATLMRSSGKWGLVTACSDGQLSYEVRDYPKQAWDMPEVKVPHGLFTFLMAASRYGPYRGGRIMAPGDRDGDGKISWKEAFDYAVEHMPRLGPIYARWRGAGPGMQRPQMFGHVSPEFTDAIFCLAEPTPGTTITDAILPDQIVVPFLDENDRFYAYSDIVAGKFSPMPFVPYGWFWSNSLGHALSPTAVQQMMDYDLSNTEDAYRENGTCVSWTLRWSGQTVGTNSEPWDLSWAGIGWFSGPDLPAWWAQDGDNRGRYFNLESPRRFKSLRFVARTPDPGTRLKVVVGILSRDAARAPLILGDSVSGPIEYSFPLTSSWTAYEVPLTFSSNAVWSLTAAGHDCPGTNRLCRQCGNNPVNPRNNDRSRICSFGFVLDKKDQPKGNTNTVVRVLVDDIYFEPFPQL